jgi:hypothetical protein
MKRLLLTVLLSVVTLAGHAASPSFEEVYSILKTNLTGVTEKDLQGAAVEGLLSKLGNRAVLVTNVAKADDAESKPRPVVTASSVFDTAYGYVRLGDLNEGADKAVGEAMHQIASTNKLKGFVLDLRFAKGRDHQGVFKVADCFFPADKTIATIGGKAEQSTGRSALPQVPMVILVNKKSQDAVEVLAASLRAAKVGLLLGSQTAGQLSLYRDIPLSTGQTLRVATGEIRFDDGSVMPFDGVKPDIKVDVSLLDEQMYLADAYKVIGDTATNKTTAATTPGRLINEAELVRRHREGLNPDVEIVPAKPGETTGKVIRDPALARALDLVKGLSMVRDYKSKK